MAEEKEVVQNGSILTDLADKFKDGAKALDGSTNYKEKHRFLKNVIGVYGICHSSGTSSFITELAYKFATNGYTVAIVDGHFLTPFFRIYYDLNPAKSFTDKIENSDTLDDVIINSKLHENINYIAQGAISLDNLLTLDNDEDNTNCKRVTAMVKKLKQTYDIVLIDIDPELLTTGIEHGLLKACEQFIQLNIESIKNEIDRVPIEHLINLTCRFDAKTMKVFNKVQTPKDIYLPYEDGFKATYNETQVFLQKGVSFTTDYADRFQILYDFLLSELDS